MPTQQIAEESRTPRSPVLLIDVREPYRSALCAWGQQAEVAVLVSSLDSAAFAGSEPISLCVVGMPERAAAFATRLRAVRKQFRSRPIVAVARALSVDSIVQLLRSGATDVIELTSSVEDLVVRIAALHAGVADLDDEDGLVGRSSTMQELRRQIREAAPTQSTVLLTGETGVGKGLVARRLHAFSKRSQGPFVHVDCSSFAPTIVESELFGHERGAFTGATTQRIGRFEQANGGALFLDEIGDLDLPLQRKLLRVLQDRQFERVGGTRPLPLTARVIAATHRDLHGAVSRGEFRADLLFRLNVIHLEVPPLRERLQDIPQLVQVGVAQLSERLEIDPPQIENAFLARLAHYWWPGNVRELMNVLERVLVRHRSGSLDEESVEAILATAERNAAMMSGAVPPLLTQSPPLTAATGRRRRRGSSGRPVWVPPGPPGAHPGDAGEVDAIRALLRDTGGNLSRAARRVGVPRSTLRYRVLLLGLEALLLKD